MRSDFAAFILTHGRPDTSLTVNSLKTSGYTGKLYFIVDNEDKTVDQYIKRWGKENVIIFDKLAMSKTFDECDNFDNRKSIVYARNACFPIAEKLGIKYFIELDDDYTWFGFRTPEASKQIKDLDAVLESMLDLYISSGLTTIAMSQGGDHIGGYKPHIPFKRKAMNSFICSTDRPFQFSGRINEDVNTYVGLGAIGKTFLTIMNIQLTQKATQSNKGGMTDIYMDGGTYVKSFYTIITCPSSVKIRVMGTTNKRLHHSINWNVAVPKIIEEKWKK